MHKNIHVLLIIWGCFGLGFSQQKPPKALFVAINQYLNDGESLTRNLKGLGLDASIRVEEVDVGIPAEIFVFKGWKNKDFADRLNTSAPVMSIIESTGSWEFSLKARGQYLFGVEFECKNGICEWATTGGSKAAWKEVKAAYPDSSGINPLIIRHGRKTFLHFPQINKYNLTLLTDSSYRAMLKNEWRDSNAKKGQNIVNFLEIDGLLSTTTDSYAILADSKKTLKYLKDRSERFKGQSINSEGVGK